jgi:hypothetical protein
MHHTDIVFVHIYYSPYSHTYPTDTHPTDTHPTDTHTLLTHTPY